MFSNWEVWLPSLLIPVASVIVGVVAARQSDRANARTEGVAALSSGVETWKELAERSDRERDETRQKLESLASRMDRLEAELHITNLMLEDSLELNAQFMDWVERGAMPPAPAARPGRLRERIEELRSCPRGERGKEGTT